MADPTPRVQGKIVQAIGDDDIKWMRANQNFARLQHFIDQVERFWSVPVVPPLGFGLPFPFGDGGLGDVTISVNTAISAFDIKEYRNLTINSGVTLSTTETSVAVMILYVSQTLTVDGTIDMDGDGGVGANQGNPGNDATDYTSSYGASGGGGGGDTVAATGGDGGDTINSGGVKGGAPSGDGAAGSALGVDEIAFMRMRQDVRDFSLISWGAGGGGGGSATGSPGGHGGGGILIFANKLIVSSSGIITADGLVSASSPTSNSGGGGGGGGGFIYIVSKNITNDGSIAAAAGPGRAGDGAAGDGGAGGAGTVIQEEIP